MYCWLYTWPLSPLPVSSSSLGRLLCSEGRCDLDLMCVSYVALRQLLNSLGRRQTFFLGKRATFISEMTKRILPLREVVKKNLLLLPAISTPEEFHPSRRVCQVPSKRHRGPVLCLPSSLRPTKRWPSATANLRTCTSLAIVTSLLAQAFPQFFAHSAGELIAKKMCPQCTCRLGQFGLDQGEIPKSIWHP